MSPRIAPKISENNRSKRKIPTIPKTPAKRLLDTKAKAGTPTPPTSVVLQASKNPAGLCFWSYSADQNKSSGPSLFHHEISFPLLPSSSLHSQNTPTKLRQRSPHLKIQAPPVDQVCVCVCVSLSLCLSFSVSLCVSQNPNPESQLKSYSQSLLLCLCVCVWDFLCGILRVNSLHSRGNKDLCNCRGRAAL
jgi:hypothetical protein